MINIEKYKSNYWAVYDDGILICVAVYKKGATEVAKRLSALNTDNLAEMQIDHDKLTKLFKELKTINRNFNRLIMEIKATDNKPFEAVLYNQNENRKGEDH